MAFLDDHNRDRSVLVVVLSSEFRFPRGRVGYFLDTVAVLLTQVLFVWNVVQAIIKMPRLHN